MLSWKWFYCPFWEDLWSPVILSQRFPSLFQHAANNSSSVKEVMPAPDLASVFNLPLSQEAYDELVEMQETLSIIPYDPNANDHWAFLWGNDRYSSQKLYKLAFATMDVPRTFSLIWKCQCTLRVRIFAWLILVDRLNTRVMLRRCNFHIQGGYNCVFCHLGVDEDVDHLLFACPFAERCWRKLHVHWNLSLDIHARIMQARQASSYSFFMEIFLIAAWEIWKLRNAIIFYAARGSLNLWIVRFKEHVLLQSVRFSHDKEALVKSWISSL